MHKSKVLVGLVLFSIILANCKKEVTKKPIVTDANYEDSLKRNLWAYFDFNNGSFNDLSGNSRHMTGANGINFSFDTWGNNTNALEFDGIDDYAIIEAGKNFPEGDFTINFLMMPRQNSGRIFQKANFTDAKGASFGFGFDQDLGTQNLHFYIANDNEVCTKFTDASNSSIQPVNRVIYPFAWYLITIQYANGIQKIFINGKFLTAKVTQNKTFKNCTAAPFYLGMWWLQDRRHFSGKIDELRIYSRALSEKEIKYLFDRLP